MAENESAQTARPGFRLSATDYEKYLSMMNLEDWDEGGDLSRFAYLRTSTIFPVATIPRQGAVAPLTQEEDSTIANYPVKLADGRELSFDRFVSTVATVDGIVIVRRGEIVYERYPHMDPSDKHLLFSSTKAFVGTLVGILEAKGLLDTGQPVERYILELEGSAWAGTSVRDILDMTSGIAAPDGGITNPKSEHYRLEASLGWLPIVPELSEAVKEGRTYDFLAALGRATEPGLHYVYSSANSLVLGWLIEKVTGRAPADALFDHIWSKMGAESDAQLIINRRGIAVSHAGLITTLRDLARFGLLFTGSWRAVAEEEVIPASLIRTIQQGRPRLAERQELFPKEVRVGWPGAYQWDRAMENGAFFKSGYAGQMLHISPRSDLVVAYVGTEEFHDTDPTFSAVVRSLLAEVVEHS